MILLILGVVSLILTLLFIITIVFVLGEKVQVFLVRTLMSDDEIYQVYHAFMFIMVFLLMFMTSIATYNTFIK